jgi:hypothetical protein
VPRVCTQTRASSTIETPLHPRRCELLLTIGILHTAFLLGFYGWTGSWTYYSYLPILALCLLISLLPPRPRIRWSITAPLIALTLLAHLQLASEIIMAKWKEETPNRLWAYPAQRRELDALLAAHGGKPTLLMTIGWISDLPPNVELPQAWFPEPGIPTASEIARVKTQAAKAEYVILWNEYRKLDLWNSPDFAPIREQFEPAQSGKYLTLLRRRP